MLIAMAGLPAAGKSSIAEELARTLPAAVVSVDPVESAIRRAGIDPADQPTGLAAYLVAEAVADGLLTLGHSVVVDAVNAVEEARGQWIALAARHGTRCVFAEVTCADAALRRRRVESRDRGLPQFPEPTWEDVCRVRDTYAAWTCDRLVLDGRLPPPANAATVRATALGG